MGLSELNNLTQDINPYGSPFFNIYLEYYLSGLSNTEVRQLIDLSGSHFSNEDRQYIRKLAGNHPYLLQAIASSLWEAIEDQAENIDDPYDFVTQRTYHELGHYFSDIWNSWRRETRQAFTAIALLQSEDPLSTQGIDKNIISDIAQNNFSLELRSLELKGVLERDPVSIGGWRIVSEIMLYWLADELSRTTREDKAFFDWLEANVNKGVFSRTQRENFNQAARNIVKLAPTYMRVVLDILARM